MNRLRPRTGTRRAVRYVILCTAAIVGGVGACHDITAPVHPDAAARKSYLTTPAGTVVVSPEDMHGWTFMNDQSDIACANASACQLVDGPAGQPLGSGSAELATLTASDGKALRLVDYAGLRFDHVTDLRYSTHRQSSDPGSNLAIALQFNADYDLTDAATGYQGRLVFEPYQGSGGQVPQDTWQAWDAKAGKWWGTKASVARSGVPTANPCVQSTPCTWAQLLAAFPNVGVHATYGAVYLKAGSNWAGFRGNVDALTIGVDGTSTTFDFEHVAGTMTALPPANVPEWIYADTNFVSDETTIAGRVAKNVVMVAFDPGTPVSIRQAALTRVNATVVGGIPIDDDGEGVYYVRPGLGQTPELVLNAVHALASAPGVAMAIPVINDSLGSNYLRPIDGLGATRWQIDREKADGENWALESIDAPMAWGCSTGRPSTAIAVIDQGYHSVFDIIPAWVEHYDETAERHATAVASILTAQGYAAASTRLERP